MEVLTNKTGLNKVTLDILLDFITKNCCNKQNYEEIIVVNSKELADDKVTYSNFLAKLKATDSLISFCPEFTKNFSYFKNNNSELLIFNINSIDLTPNTSISSKKSVDLNFNFKSFFLSILYCLADNKHLKDSLVETLITNINKFTVVTDLTKLNIKKTKLNKSLKNNIIDNDVLRIVSEYLYVNIFVFNHQEENFMYCSGEFVPFKKNIVLYFYNNIYYPIVTKANKVFAFSSELIKYFLSDVSKIKCTSINEFIVAQEDIASYINKDQTVQNIILPEVNLNQEVSKDDTNSIINGFDDQYSPTDVDDGDGAGDDEEDENNNKYEKYMSYSLKELQKLVKDKDIDIKNKSGKFKTKKELVDNLLS